MKYKVLGNVILGLFAATVLVAEVCSQTTNLQLQNTYTFGATAATPRIAVGDLNNDGRPDIVTTAGLNNSPVNILLNNGSGGFGPPNSFGATLNASAVAIADFNNDGFADLAIGTITNSGLNIRLGNGSGAFPNEVTTATVDVVTDIVAADFNRDGNMDVAITKNGGYSTAPTNSVHVLLGNGQGGFGTFTAFAIGSAPLDLEVGDYNADGRPDIAALAFATSNTVSILLNTGPGFTAAPSISYSNATSAGKMASGDFNRDCITDLAVVRSDSIAILIGNNTGAFTLSSITTNPPASVAIADFNLDRIPDLAIGRINTSGNTGFTVLPGNGDGNFGSAFTVNSPDITDNLALLDINSDGKMDVAMSRRSNAVSVYSNAANQFKRTPNDFDADGRSDLRVYRPTNGNWYFNLSTLGFYQTKFGVTSDKPVPADYDGDGRSDIAIWRENGTGQSQFWILQSATNTLRYEDFGIAGDDPSIVADFDGDGKADPAVFRDSGVGQQSYFFYRGSLNNPTRGTTYSPWGTGGDRAVPGDFDGDGRADLTVFRPSDLVWYILQSSNGQPAFPRWGVASDKRVPADYDGDGRTDLAVFRPSDSIWYILNSSTGTPTYYRWGVSDDTLVPGDYNGDGKAEPTVFRPSDQRWYVPPCATYPGGADKFGAPSDMIPLAVQ